MTKDASPVEGSANRFLRPGRVGLYIGIVGLVITATVTATAWTLNRNNERRLLQAQTRQAGGVLASTILTIKNPLDTALQIESATDGSVQQLDRFLAAYTGPGRLFVHASLWRTDGTGPRPVAAIGVAPALSPGTTGARSFIARASTSATFAVTGIPAGRPRRIGYAIGNPTFAVYAERAIPANRRVAVESNSAFADLYYATYLGSAPDPSELATTDLPPGQLPLTGDTARINVPFGDISLTLVTAPMGQLGGTLGGQLPWIFLVGGILLTVATAFGVEQMARRRSEAERDARTITGLYGRLDHLYGEQRTIAETLQRALLPQGNPKISNLEIASRYVAGAHGVDIGGDWYSLIPVDDHRFAFVVGDVSGRGVDAAAIMARLRFTIRAYLTEGHAPEVVLDMCSRQIDVNSDGHFATVLVGVGDLDTGEIVLANAGHLDPLVVAGPVPYFVSTNVGPPLGVTSGAYTSDVVQLPAGATFLAFTDGLVERRGEDIQLGLDRLKQAAAGGDVGLEDLLTMLLSHMAAGGSEDDIAILAFRTGSTGARAGDDAVSSSK